MITTEQGTKFTALMKTYYPKEMREYYGNGENQQWRIYLTSLQFQDYEDLETAFAIYVGEKTNGRFFPKPSDFNNIVADFRMEADGTLTPGEAWKMTRLAITLYDTNPRYNGGRWQGRDELPETVVKAIEAIGGPRQIALAEEGTDLNILQNRFTKAYEVEVSREATQKYRDPRIAARLAELAEARALNSGQASKRLSE